MMLNGQPVNGGPNFTRKLMDLFHFRSTPRRINVVSWGYDRNTKSGVRDWWATGLLCFFLVVCAFTVGGLTDTMQLVNIRADLCKARDGTLASNMALMRNITK